MKLAAVILSKNEQGREHGLTTIKHALNQGYKIPKILSDPHV